MAAPYAIAQATPLDFPTAAARIRDALKSEGFGVLTEIDLQQTLRDKIGAELEPYIILGACNPPLAHRAVQAEPAIGLLLPCNVVIRESGGQVYVEAMDPEAVMGIVGNAEVRAVAADARARLLRALRQLDD